MMRRHIILFGLVTVVCAFGWAVAKKEAVLSDGEMILLPLAPVDPRSLMQGDYMVLDYQLLRELTQNERNRFANTSSAQRPQDQPERLYMDGAAVIALDERRIGRFIRIDDGTPLEAGQVSIKYKRRGGHFQLGAESYFFQEGTGKTFEQARYGELRLDADGTSVLVGLRDEQARVLGGEQRLH